MNNPGQRIEKPWGYEIIWAHTDQYVGKLLVIEAGKRLSLQKHLRKEESIYVVRGRLQLELADEQGRLCRSAQAEGEHLHIPPGRAHRFGAGAERVELIEVSTPELDDVVRIEDDYGRAPAAQRGD